MKEESKKPEEKDKDAIKSGAAHSRGTTGNAMEPNKKDSSKEYDTNHGRASFTTGSTTQGGSNYGQGSMQLRGDSYKQGDTKNEGSNYDNEADKLGDTGNDKASEDESGKGKGEVSTGNTDYSGPDE